MQIISIQPINILIFCLCKLFLSIQSTLLYLVHANYFYPTNQHFDIPFMQIISIQPTFWYSFQANYFHPANQWQLAIRWKRRTIYIPCSLSLRLLGSLWGSLGTSRFTSLDFLTCSIFSISLYYLTYIYISILWNIKFLLVFQLCDSRILDLNWTVWSNEILFFIKSWNYSLLCYILSLAPTDVCFFLRNKIKWLIDWLIGTYGLTQKLCLKKKAEEDVPDAEGEETRKTGETRRAVRWLE